MRGIPVSSCTRMSPVDTASAMYSKCMVSPFMRTPMAMMASKGAVEEVFGVSETEREVRSVVEAPSRSPAERVEVCVLWIWEAEKSFEHAIGSSQLPGTDCTTILLSFTPEDSSFFLVPSRRGSMIVVFHLACTMPMRSALPSSVGACPGPLSDAIVSVSCVVCWEIGVRWWVEWTAVG